MGNCMVPASSMEWGGDDWGDDSLRSENSTRSSSSSSSSSSKVFVETDHHVLSLANYAKKEKLLRALKSSCDGNGEVRIKISKKEVAELLGAIQENNNKSMKKKQVGGSAEQVLIRLINGARDRDHENYHHHHHGPWRPVLETVPEN